MKVELEFDDKGELVGDQPEQLKALFSRAETMAYGNGHRNGTSETTIKSKAQFDELLKVELAKKDALAPMERARFAELEESNKALNSRLTQSVTEQTKVLREREEAHSREILTRSEREAARNKRIDALVQDQLEGYAVAYGARDESLPELKVILKNYIGYSEDMEPYVKGDDGQPRTAQGKPVSIKAFVKEYLDSHLHHRKPNPGVGGGARGGASFQRASHDTPSIQAAQKRIDEGDRSASAINELFEASRRKAG